MQSRLYQQFKEQAVPRLMEKMGYKNRMQAPKLKKVTLNVGYGRHVKEAGYIENVGSTLSEITGQKPVHNKAKKSISNFKIRKGLAVGASVTLRGKRMYDFVDKLVSVTLPRVRDFHGVSPKSFDRQGNYALGLKENIAFPEMASDAVDKIHGLEIIISTTAKNQAEGRALLEEMGFPFSEK